MRNFRTFVNDPAGNDPASTNFIGGTNLNNALTELENSVTRAGLTLTTDDGTPDAELTQLAQSLFLHGVKSTSFQAAGTVDAITLTPVSGASGVFIPANYDHVEGARLTFVPTGANTGAVTVSIGQTTGTQLGTKKLLDSSGADLTGGELDARIEAIYDPAADSAVGAFLLVPWSAAGTDIFSEEFISAEQTITTGGALTIAHGLTGTPKLVQALLRNKTAELNYSIGDEIDMAAINSGTDSMIQWGWATYISGSNVKVAFGNTGMVVPNAVGGVRSNITNGNWKLIIKVWA